MIDPLYEDNYAMIDVNYLVAAAPIEIVDGHDAYAIACLFAGAPKTKLRKLVFRYPTKATRDKAFSSLQWNMVASYEEESAVKDLYVKAIQRNEPTDEPEN